MVVKGIGNVVLFFLMMVDCNRVILNGKGFFLLLKKLEGMMFCLFIIVMLKFIEVFDVYLLGVNVEFM